MRDQVVADADQRAVAAAGELEIIMGCHDSHRLVCGAVSVDWPSFLSLAL